jgi:hypothetical protein
MKREGKTLAVVPDGHPRRLSDAKTSWRKMTWVQREEILRWIFDETRDQGRPLAEVGDERDAQTWVLDAVVEIPIEVEGGARSDLDK